MSDQMIKKEQTIIKHFPPHNNSEESGEIIHITVWTMKLFYH